MVVAIAPPCSVMEEVYNLGFSPCADFSRFGLYYFSIHESYSSLWIKFWIWLLVVCVILKILWCFGTVWYGFIFGFLWWSFWGCWLLKFVRMVLDMCNCSLELLSKYCSGACLVMACFSGLASLWKLVIIVCLNSRLYECPTYILTLLVSMNKYSHVMFDSMFFLWTMMGYWSRHK